MYSVKVESVKRNSICRGCLSTDRKVGLLQNYVDVFYTLLGAQQEYCETQVLLCWECRAHLKNIQTFQNRIQHAQFILQQQSLYDLELPVTPLSTLSLVIKSFYDETFDYESTTLDKEIKNDVITDVQPLIISQKSIKQENTDDDDSSLIIDDTFSDNEVLTIDYNKLEQLNIIDKNIEKEKLSKNKSDNYKGLSIKRYESKATVKKLIEDLDELKKRWVKVKVTNEEIEELLLRDRMNCGYTNLPNKCAECKNAYKRLIDLRRHETFQHMKLSFPTKCKECKATVSSLEALQAHWTKHNVYNKCDLCGWLSYSLSSMSKHHKRVHTNVYCCTACDVQCQTLREFRDHYHERHERIICDHCGKSFIRKRSLEVHIKRHHTPATCLECNKTYAHYHVLENHYRMSHPHMVRADNRTELAYCVECDKQFPSVYKYRRHLATAAKHTPPKAVRIPCPECGKVFSRKIRMTNHLNSVHRNTTKHRCDLCNKTFCSAFSARTHRQHVHEKIPMPKNKMCDICGRGFSTNRILTNHRRTHTGERPYKCSHCPATFAQRTAMKTHERTQHKTQWESNSALSAAATLLELGDRDGN